MSRLFTRRERLSSSATPIAGRAAPVGAGAPPAAPSGAAPGGSSQAAEYVELLAKLIPGEIVALYTFVMRSIPLVGTGKDAVDPEKMTPLHHGLMWFAVVLCVVLTPVVLRLQEPKPADPGLRNAWNVRLWLATVAFPVWAYVATGKDLFPGKQYDPGLAVIAAAVYAVVAGIIARLVSPARPR